MDYSEFLTQVKHILKAIDQVNFLHSNTEDIKLKIESLCVAYLNAVGYKTIKPFDKYDNISYNNNEELLLLFNDLKFKHYGVHAGSAGVANLDHKHIKNFVKARMEANKCNMNEARKECAVIIKTIFSNLSRFNFREPPRPVFLGQKAFGWVTQLALDIIDEEYAKHLEKEIHKIKRKANDTFNDNEFGLV